MPHGAVGFVTGLVMGVAAVGLTAVSLAQGGADERAVSKVIADRQVAWNTGDAEGTRGSSRQTPISRAATFARGRDAIIQRT